MQVLTEQKTESILTLDITIPSDAVERELDLVAGRIQKGALVNGFRKGMAPIQVIKQQFQDTVRAEASTKLIQTGVVDAIRSQNLKNVGNPILQDQFLVTDKKKYPGKYRLDGSFNFKIDVELPPKVDFSNYTGIEVSVPVSSFDQWFSSEMKKNQVLFGEKNTVDRVAQTGDQVLVDYEGFLDGAPLSGSKEENQSFIIGEKTILPDLESGFIGRRPGETFSHEFVIAPDFNVPALRDRLVVFNCVLREVVEIIPHEINDSLAQMLSFESVETMRQSYRGRYESEYKKVVDGHIFSAVMENIISRHPFEVPRTWIEQEVRVVANRLKIKHTDVMNSPQLLSQIVPIAEKSVKSAYILDKVYEKEVQLHLNQDEIQVRLSQLAERNGLSVDSFLSKVRSEGSSLESLISQFEQTKAMEFLIASAIVKE